MIEIRRVKGELGERLAASEDEGLREAGESLRAALDEVEGGDLPGAEPVEPGSAELSDQGE